jgi:hypothetical protein
VKGFDVIFYFVMDLVARDGMECNSKLSIKSKPFLSKNKIEVIRRNENQGNNSS